MLFHNQGQPFPLRDLFKYIELMTGDNSPDVFTLLAENAGENRKAVLPENPLEFREEAHNDICSEIAEQQVNGIALHGIQRAAKCTDVVFRIALDVRAGNLHRNRINVAGKNPLRAQKARRYGQDTGARTDVQDNVGRLDPAL